MAMKQPTKRRRSTKIQSKPFPPGRYPVVIVGSGPGGLQTSHFLRRLGVEHAVLSADAAPGGMFLRYPLFQRLISWSKPYAPAVRGTRPYAWYDWNSLLSDDQAHQALVPEFMDGSSYFPSRAEMERGLAAFVRRARVQVRYGCRWEATRKTGDGFTLSTSDGEYACRAFVLAVGMAEPWKPDVPGLDLVPHYVQTKPPCAYADRHVVILGKRNSGFEVADALLPWARQIILLSPRPALLSIHSHSTAGVRARYLLPYEDHALGGGVFALDAATDRVERTGSAYRVFATGTTRPGDYVFDAGAVIAATGFTTPLQDLRALGLATFNQDRLPALTPFWESTTVPGVFFAGTVTQGAIGLKKHGIPSNSGGVGGFRHNARVLARYLAEKHFAIAVPRPTIRLEEVVPYLLSEVARAPELWNQRSYLARVVSFDRREGIRDEGIAPLAHFVDTGGPDAAAIVLETDQTGDHHPAVYTRRGGSVTEHVLPSNPLHNFETSEYHAQLAALLDGLV